MPISRRDLLMYGASLGAALPLIATVNTGRADNDGDGGGDDGHDGDGNSYRTDAAQRFAAFASGLNCSRRPELPLITGDNSINGGLRYDDEMSVAPAGVAQWTLQRAAKLRVIPLRTQPGAIPMTTIGAIATAEPESGTKWAIDFHLAMFFLIHTCGLDRAALSFKTVDTNGCTTCSSLCQPGDTYPQGSYCSNAGYSTGVVWGISPSQTSHIPEAVAHAQASGAGWYEDPRNHIGLDSVSIHYTRGNLTRQFGHSTPTFFAFHMEFLQWAMSGAIPSWNQVLPTLLARIRAEAHRAHVPLPAGYAQFAASGN